MNPLFRRISLCLVLAVFIGLGFAGLVSAAVEVPSPTRDFYVLDQAGVLSQETKSAIIGTSAELASKTKAQVVVVTLKTLDGRPIEDVSLAILRDWRIGDQKLNNGVLILLVPSERKSRIEVGYGLEGALPDAKTGRIQDERMLPYFKEGKYDEGILTGYRVIAGEVGREYNVTVEDRFMAPSAAETQTQPARRSPLWVAFWVIVILALFWLDYRFLNGLLFGILIGMLSRGGWRGGGGGDGGFSGGGGSGGGGGSSRDW